MLLRAIRHCWLDADAHAVSPRSAQFTCHADAVDACRCSYADERHADIYAATPPYVLPLLRLQRGAIERRIYAPLLILPFRGLCFAAAAAAAA